MLANLPLHVNPSWRMSQREELNRKGRYTMIRSFFKEEDGQDLVEYSLLLAFIALAAVAALTSVKTQISTIWSKVNSRLTTAAS